MSGSTFTWSQGGAFLFNSTSLSLRGDLPPGAEDFITRKEVANVHSMTLGKGNCYLFTYCDPNGTDHIAYSGLPKNLIEWLERKDNTRSYSRDFPSTRVVMGPHNEALFARDSSDFYWSDLPRELNDCIKNLRLAGGGWSDRPKIVSLGDSGNYVLLTESGARYWKLGNYRELDKLFDLITERRMGGSFITNVCLNPYRIDNWVLETSKGDLVGHGMYSQCESSFRKMQAIVAKDAAAAVSQGKQGPSTAIVKEIDALWAAYEKIRIKRY